MGDLPSLPSNSHASKAKQDKKIEKKVKGEVEVRKKTLGKKFTETMFNTDVKAIKYHMVNEVIIPSILEFIFNGLHDFIDTMFRNGDGPSYRPKSSIFSSGANSQEPYEKYYYKSANAVSAQNKPSYVPLKSPYDIYECVFTDRGEADSILEEMRSIIGHFKVVTLNDYYELIGKTSELGGSTDSNYGWRNLDGASIQMVRGRHRGERGYVINLPRPEQIN